MNRRGKLITIDGCDGAGKSTQAMRVAHQTNALLTREPGATQTGAEIRRIILQSNNEDLTPEARMLLFSADRNITRTRVIEPALATGSWVVSNRSYLSSVAYQGFGEGLSRDYIIKATNLALGSVTLRNADLAVILDIPYEVAQERLSQRGSPLDNFERQGQGFHDRVRNGFRILADNLGSRALFIDASGTKDEVFEQISTGVEPLQNPTNVGGIL